MTFTAEQTDFSFTLESLAEGDRRMLLEGPDQYVVARRVQPTIGDIQVEWEWVDEGIQPGINPYHVKVTQVDSHMAWSSPVYVYFSPES